MRQISAALEAYLAGPWQTNARCLKITMRNHQPEIIDITNANPAVIQTKWAHGWETDYSVQLVQIKGMTNLNFQEYTITVIDPTHFSVPVDSTAFDEYIAGGIARRIIGFTTYLRGLTFEGVLYNASEAYVPSEIRAVSDLSVSNFSLLGMISSDAITDLDIERGLYDNAKLNFFMVNYRDLTMGKVELPGGTGNLGQVKTRKTNYEAEFKALEHYLQQDVGHVYSPLCRVVELGYSPEDRFGQDGSGEGTDDINFCYVKVDPPKWKANTEYAARLARDARGGSVVKPIVYNGRHFKCSIAGTSGGSEPTWATTIGGTTVDGSATWETIDALTKYSTVSQVISSRFWFIDYDREEADQWYQFGRVVWLTGENIGMKFEIKNFRGYPYDIASVTTSTKTFRIEGDVIAWFNFGESMQVLGSTGNDTEFDINGFLAPEKKNDPITTIEILGDYTARFPTGKIFTIAQSDFNDGSYTTESSVYVSSTGVTRITVDGEFDGATIGGVIQIPYTINTVAYNAGTNRTEITVLETVSSGVADGIIYHNPKTIEFFRDTPFDIQPGDQFEIKVGCDKRRAPSCRDKFDNIYNFRGEPYVPGQDRLLLTPDAKA